MKAKCPEHYLCKYLHQKQKTHPILCFAFFQIFSLWFLSHLSSFLPPLFFSLNTSLQLFLFSSSSGLYSCACSLQNLLYSCFFHFSSNFTMYCRTVHWAIWTTTAFQALSLSKSCVPVLDACCWGSKTRKGRGRETEECGRGKVTKTLSKWCVKNEQHNVILHARVAHWFLCYHNNMLFTWAIAGESNIGN